MSKLGKTGILGNPIGTAPAKASRAGRSKGATAPAPGADARSNDAETISLILFRRHLVFLDRYAADCRERGTKATRTAIVRALVEALEAGKVDISEGLRR